MAGSTIAWTPAANDGSLLTRIRRVLSPTTSPSKHAQRLSMIAAVLLLVGVPFGLAACASQQSTTETESQQATAEENTETSIKREAPPAPKEPSNEAKRRKVIVVQDDSTKRTVRVASDGPVEVDSLEEDVYVFRYDGRTDTLDLTHLDDLPDLDRLDQELELRFDPDSLERAIRMRIDPDSLERVLRARLNPDRIEREIRLRLDADSLEERALRLRLHADSMTRQMHPFIHPDSLERDVRVRVHSDSLARWHHEHADSLRRHFEQMRERWEHSDRVLPGVRMQREMPEHLREQARHLREQAERLEERARELEVPPSPKEPEAPSRDTSGTSDASGLDGRESLGGGREEATTFSERQYAAWAREVAERLDYDVLVNGRTSSP